MFIRNHHRHDSQERGQILLITVMLLAAAVTVVMTIAFNSTTETQITKMEEDSQSALSAAETALEAAIQKKASVALSDIPSFTNSNITGEATVVEMGGNEFVTPLLQRDEQYTFYLSKYSSGVFSNFWTGGIVMYLQSETGANCAAASTNVALELTFVNSDDTFSRNLIDPCGIVQDPNSNHIVASGNGSVQGTTFAYKTSATDLVLGSLASKKMLIVRVLNAPTRIGFTGGSMPTQGRVITSEAKTSTGVMKKIQLFQSYPQIPSDFFVTSF